MSLPAAFTDGKGNLPTNPFSLGKRAVGTAGTGVQLCGNATDLANVNVKWLSIRGLDTNSGTIYVVIEPLNTEAPFNLPGGGTTNGADTTNFLNVVQWLSAGETWSVPSEMLNQILLGQFWIDGTNAGDGVVASAYIF